MKRIWVCLAVLAAPMADAASSEKWELLRSTSDLHACHQQCISVVSDGFQNVERRLEEAVTFKEMVRTKAYEWDERLSSVKGVFRDRATDRALAACRAVRLAIAEANNCRWSCYHLAILYGNQAGERIGENPDRISSDDRIILGWLYSPSDTNVVTQFGRRMTELLKLGVALGAWPSEHTNGLRDYRSIARGSYGPYNFPVNSASWQACRTNQNLDW